MSLITSPCPVCQRPIQQGDVVARIMVGHVTGWAHITCTKEGVQRWKREDGGETFEDPLRWERATLPTWRDERPHDQRSWRHVGTRLAQSRFSYQR